MLHYYFSFKFNFEKSADKVKKNISGRAEAIIIIQRIKEDDKEKIRNGKR